MKTKQQSVLFAFQSSTKMFNKKKIEEMRTRKVSYKFKQSKCDETGMIYISYLRSMCKTGVTCKLADYSADDECIKGSDPCHQAKNKRLRLIKTKVVSEIGENRITEEEFTDLCNSIIFPEKYTQKKKDEEHNKAMSFTMCMQERMKLVEKKKTLQIYAHTLSLVEAFTTERFSNQKVTIDDITVKWLNEFEKWLRDKGTKTNGIGMHMRNIRTVCNYALKEAYTTNYPFKQYKIRKEETAKRSLNIEQLRELRDFECDVRHERYRDMFMLMFYLRGINAVDLFNATHENIRNGRFEYRRSKTGAFISVKIEPEAQAILDKYSGGEHLINCIDDCKWDTFMQHMDKELKKIGPTTFGKHGKKVKIQSICADLTSYWSRHTWATMAADIDIPKETIGKALGHAWACVTDTYIKFNMKKVDDASRKVIDYLNGNFKSQEQWQEELRQQQEAAAAEQKHLLEESQRKQDELLEANRQMQQQLLTLMQQMVFK